MTLTRKITVAITMSAILCAVVLFAGAVILMLELSGTAPAPAKELFVRQIYILLDRTMSLNYRHDDLLFREAKARIKRSVFPALGAGDRVACYSVGSDFVESDNRVFDSSAIPPIPDLLLDSVRAALVPRSRIDALSQQVRLALEDPATGLNARLDALTQQKGGWTNYLAAIRYAGQRLAPSPDSNIQERYLIVIGDLEQNPSPPSLEPTAVMPSEVNAFAGVSVVLVEPYRLEHGTDPRARERRLDFWKQYFTARGNSAVAIRTLDAPDTLLPVSAVPGAPDEYRHTTSTRHGAKEDPCCAF
jgi:hypothetical protein